MSRWTPAARRRLGLLLGLAAAAVVIAVAFSGDDASHVFAGEFERSPTAELTSPCAQPYVVVLPDPILLERERRHLLDAAIAIPRPDLLQVEAVPREPLRAEAPDPSLWKRLREAIGPVTAGTGGGAGDDSPSPVRLLLDAEACNQ